MLALDIYCTCVYQIHYENKAISPTIICASFAHHLVRLLDTPVRRKPLGQCERITSFRAEYSHWPTWTEPMVLAATWTSVEDGPPSNNRGDFKRYLGAIVPRKQTEF